MNLMFKVKGDRILRDGCLKRAIKELAWANASDRLGGDAQAVIFQKEAIPKLYVKFFTMIEKGKQDVICTRLIEVVEFTLNDLEKSKGLVVPDVREHFTHFIVLLKCDHPGTSMSKLQRAYNFARESSSGSGTASLNVVLCRMLVFGVASAGFCP